MVIGFVLLATEFVATTMHIAFFAVGAFGAIPGLRDHALTLPWEDVWEIFRVNLWVKALVSAVSLPLIYLSRDRDWSADEGDA